MSKAIQPPLASLVRRVAGSIGRPSDELATARRATRELGTFLVVETVLAIVSFALGIGKWWSILGAPLLLGALFWQSRQRYRVALRRAETARSRS